MELLEPVSGGGVVARLLLVLFLVFANAFFVASEFALVAARRSKIDQLVSSGDARAKTVQGALKHLDRYISGTQLGITIASLALGWIGEPALAAAFHFVLNLFGVPNAGAISHSTAAIVLAFFIVTFLHVVFGELTPKSIALTVPEGTSKIIAAPLMLFSRIMSPLISLLNGSGNFVLRLVGITPVTELHSIHSPAELRLLVM